MVSVGDPVLAIDLGVSCRLGSDFNLATSSTALANVTGMSVSVVAGRIYQLTGVIAASAASTTPDMKFGLTFPTGSFRLFAQVCSSLSTTTASDYTIARQPLSSGSSVAVMQLSTSSTFAIIFGEFNCTTSGTVQLQAAQNTSSGDLVTIQSSTHLRFMPL